MQQHRHTCILIRHKKLQKHFKCQWFISKLSQRSTHISSTQPNASSTSGSCFMANDTFIQVGAIFFRDSCNHQERVGHYKTAKRRETYHFMNVNLSNNYRRISYWIDIGNRSFLLTKKTSSGQTRAFEARYKRKGMQLQARL